MSAWEVSDIHLSAMVQSMCAESAMGGVVVHPDHQDKLWSDLKHQNMTALHIRYGDRLQDHYRPRRTNVEAPLNPHVLHRAVDCYMYQCAEFDNYDKTQLSIVVLAYQQRLEDHYNFTRNTIQDLDLPWGIDTWDDVIDHALIEGMNRRAQHSTSA